MVVMLRAQGVEAANTTSTDSVLPRLVGLDDGALFQATVQFLSQDAGKGGVDCTLACR